MGETPCHAHQAQEISSTHPPSASDRVEMLCLAPPATLGTQRRALRRGAIWSRVVPGCLLAHPEPPPEAAVLWCNASASVIPLVHTGICPKCDADLGLAKKYLGERVGREVRCA